MKGLSIPMLPVKVERLYNNIFVRIFRFIGGVAFLMVISNIFLHLPELLQLFFAIMASIHITQIMIMFIMKSSYGIYTLVFKKELFEVRNSPLNRFATTLGKVLYCVKVGALCAGVGVVIVDDAGDGFSKTVVSVEIGKTLWIEDIKAE